MIRTEKITEKLKEIFQHWSGENVTGIEAVGASGSNRKYYRIKGEKRSCIGVFNEDIKENRAFFHFTRAFKKSGLNVPEIYFTDDTEMYYLLSDLGDQSLFDLRMAEVPGLVSPENKKLYKQAISDLLKFQFLAKDHINFNYCYPRPAMDKQSFQWDLNYFKYYFLKPQNILFDEQKLEQDFQYFIDLLLKPEQDYFIYRDFQSRNIMILNNTPYFIDYQGGRKGALQYDLASVVYQVKTQLPDDFKTELVDHYIIELQHFSTIEKDEFLNHFYPYVLIRFLQVLGAYGFRGLIEKRQHFIESIPIALTSLNNTLSKFDFLVSMPELKKCLTELCKDQRLRKKSSDLTIQIKSFAYKAGIPKDETGHGEGFVFDCRALPNPGRLKTHQHLSGLDQEVKDYLHKHTEIFSFKDHVFQIVEQSVNNYIERGFSHLNINFGCTGGQHRSVYFAESLAAHLKNNYQLNIKLKHTQRENWKTQKIE